MMLLLLKGDPFAFNNLMEELRTVLTWPVEVVKVILGMLRIWFEDEHSIMIEYAKANVSMGQTVVSN